MGSSKVFIPYHILKEGAKGIDKEKSINEIQLYSYVRKKLEIEYLIMLSFGILVTLSWNTVVTSQLKEKWQDTFTWKK